MRSVMSPRRHRPATRTRGLCDTGQAPASGPSTLSSRRSPGRSTAFGTSRPTSTSGAPSHACALHEPLSRGPRSDQGHRSGRTRALPEGCSTRDSSTELLPTAPCLTAHPRTLHDRLAPLRRGPGRDPGVDQARTHDARRVWTEPHADRDLRGSLVAGFAPAQRAEWLHELAARLPYAEMNVTRLMPHVWAGDPQSQITNLDGSALPDRQRLPRRHRRRCGGRGRQMAGNSDQDVVSDQQQVPDLEHRQEENAPGAPGTPGPSRQACAGARRRSRPDRDSAQIVLHATEPGARVPRMTRTRRAPLHRCRRLFNTAMVRTDPFRVAGRRQLQESSDRGGG